MAAEGPSPATSSTAAAAVPDRFHFETKYIVLSYLGLLPRPQSRITGGGDNQNEKERNLAIKAQIQEELRRLEDEITASSSTSGFERGASPVFNPANPESSVEDCLAAVGDRVAVELHTHLAAALHTLLPGPIDYQRFRDVTRGLSTHAQGGWKKVLVPLVLLQALQREGQSLATLLQLGLRFLEEEQAGYILHEGGWGVIFGLEPEGERGVTIAEDSNDIYILSGEQDPDRPSPPSSLLCADQSSSEPSSWRTESLPVSLAGHESWARMDPEDLKSLDSNEGAALAEERSENNSSNSDIVHVEREDAELLEEAAEGGAIEESMMSVLGTESELAELREEGLEDGAPLSASSAADSSTPASLLSLEEPVVIEIPTVYSAEPSLASSELPPAVPPPSEPEPPAPVVPVLAVEPAPEPEPAAAPAPVEEAPPSPDQEPSALSAEPEASPDPGPEEAELEPIAAPPPPDPQTVEEPEVAEAPTPLPEAAAGPAEEPPAQPDQAPELQVLVYGGATLVVLAAVLIYGVIRYRRK